MARDYAARNRKPPAKPAPMPGWVWLVAGLSMGLVIAAIVYIGRPTHPMPMAPAAGEAARAVPARPKVEIPPKEDPRFDFYTLLEDEQVVVGPQDKTARGTPPPPIPDAASRVAGTPSNAASAADARVPATAIPPAPSSTQLAVAKPPPAAPASPPRSGSERYIIMAGTFRDVSNAEKHQATLAMAGIEARIERITAADKTTLHRVRIGPENSLERAQQVLAQLKSHGFDGRVVRQP
jgi:cell division protein FtsN